MRRSILVTLVTAAAAALTVGVIAATAGTGSSADRIAKAADQYRKAYAHMFMTGDLLSGAIASQQNLR